MANARIMAIALQAGGVGKTTVTLNLGALLADRGRRVLLIDMDGQCNLTNGFNVSCDPSKTIYQVLVPDSPDVAPLPLSDTVLPILPRQNLFILPGSARMAYFDAVISGYDHREYRLHDAITSAKISDAYDYVLIDCPPSLGLVLLNALFAAREVLVVAQTRQRRVDALPVFVRRLLEVRKRHDTLSILGIVPNQFDRRNAHDNQAYEYVQAFAAKHGFRLFSPIATTTRIPESDSRKLPLCDFDRNTPASDALEALAEAIDSPTATTATPIAIAR